MHGRRGALPVELMRHAAAIIASCAALLTMPSAAFAHSSLVGSSPAPDSTVGEAPRQVTLRFSDPVVVPDGVVSVLDLAGTDHAADGITVDEGTVTVPVDDDGTGTRVVAWNAISDHGTEISGSFAYHVGEVTPGATARDDAVDDDATWREVTNMARAIAGTSLALLAACAAWLVARRRRARPTAAARSALLGIAAVFAVALIGGLAAGGLEVVTGTGEPAPTRIEQVLDLGDAGTATATVDPSVAGVTTIAVDVRDPDGAPGSSARRVRVRYMPADERLGALRQELAPDGDGRFVAEQVVVPFPGEWKFEVTVTRDRSSASLASFDADIHPNQALAAP